MLYTETKLFPWQMAQITKSWAQLVNYPISIVTAVFVTFVDTICKED